MATNIQFRTLCWYGRICTFNEQITVFLQRLNCTYNEYLSIQCNTETSCRLLYSASY